MGQHEQTRKTKIFLHTLIAFLAVTFMGLGPTQSITQHTSWQAQAAKITKKQVGTKTQRVKQNQQLLKLNYDGTQTVEVNDNEPTFTKANLKTNHGAWQKYHHLDRYNRPVVANALLNKKMMPTEKRESLTVDPTGWHNKKLKSGYLYNRSHLIGFQLSGQNNNPKNLITGTRALNSPEMLRFEDDIAYYLKNNPKDYVRYQVTPVFKNTELVARGVHLQAKSVKHAGLKFNVYIFNVEDGVKINYADGTSQVSANEQAQANSTTASSQQSTTSATAQSGTDNAGKINTASQGKIVGNMNSKIYHVPGQAGYKMNAANAQYFNTEAQAQAAGYRKAMR